MDDAVAPSQDVHPQRDPGSVSYSGATQSGVSRNLGPCESVFAQRVWRDSKRNADPADPNLKRLTCTLEIGPA